MNSNSPARLIYRSEDLWIGKARVSVGQGRLDAMLGFTEPKPIEAEIARAQISGHRATELGI